MPESPSDPTIKSEYVPGGEAELSVGQREAEPDIDAFIERWGALHQGRTNEEVGLELLHEGAQSFPLSNVLEPFTVRPSHSKAAIHFGVATIPSVVVDALTRHVSLPAEATVVYVPGRLAFCQRRHDQPAWVNGPRPKPHTVPGHRSSA